MTRFLVVLDVDSTLIENEVIELLADSAGVRSMIEGITSRAMNGELDFSESLRLRVDALHGLPTSAFEDAAKNIVVTDGVDELIAAVHTAGGVVGAVSGGFHELLDPLAKVWGLDEWRANRLRIADGLLTGQLDGPIIDAAAKAEALVEWANAYDIPLSQTLAIGDGANDLDMLSAAGIGIGFDPKPRVRRIADLVIDERDLSQVLAVMGLRG
ncbi:MAG: phosphoserine phosphatase SerB [Microbacteriaceae bacterium]